MPENHRQLDDQIDRWVLHPVWGLLILVTLLFGLFQLMFTWASPLTEGIKSGFDRLAEWTTLHLPTGMLQNLIVDGIIAGGGSVLAFLPQILLLFLFILILEESGYLPRAAFLLDRVMLAAGLTGRSFIPLLSSFACTIPGIMATRSIPDERDRLITILVAPLMTCSARLPVYTLLIAAFIPDMTVGRFFNLQGLVLFCLYSGGIVSALAVAWILKHFKGAQADHALLMELPPYRLPNPADLAQSLWERAYAFVLRVGTVIVALTVFLWFLCHFPTPPAGATQAPITYSFAGMLGHALQPFFAPLGFGWEICIALVPGMAAREVVVASLATIYALSGNVDDLSNIIRTQWTLATSLALLAWYVFSPQCIAMLATIRRETHSTRTSLLITTYLFVLAYLAALITYQITRGLLS